jgi:hypothetical protein
MGGPPRGRPPRSNLRWPVRLVGARATGNGAVVRLLPPFTSQIGLCRPKTKRFCLLFYCPPSSVLCTFARHTVFCGPYTITNDDCDKATGSSALPRPQTQIEALTPGQLAKRWGISADRARRLVESGQISGAFRIPSVGRYGEAIKIPMVAVIQMEQAWAIVPTDSKPLRKPRGGRSSSPPLKHFPELRRAPAAPDAECPVDAPH